MFANPKLFSDIAAVRSLSRAAAENDISQSAVTQFVQDLEKRLGVTLLDRSTRPLTVTPEGHLYAEFCREILEKERTVLAAMGKRAAAVDAELRVGSIYSLGLSEMGRLKREFSARFKGTKLVVEYLHPATVYEGVRVGRLDLGLVSFPVADKEVAVIPWRVEEMVVATPPDHLLAQSAVALPSDLRGHEFVAFEEALPIRREIDRFFREHGVELNVVAVFDSIQVIKEAVAVGTGISVLPDGTFAAEVKSGRLARVGLFGGKLVRPVGIIHRKRKKLGAAAEGFVGLVKDGRKS